MKQNGQVKLEFQFAAAIPFSPSTAAAAALRSIPAQPGVFALYGPPGAEGVAAQPYLSRAADLRRRIARLLAPPELTADGTPVRSKRLNLRERVARIEYTVTGSEWESVLVLYRAATAVFGPDEARRRLRLHTPFFVRFAAENAFPRLYVTNRLSRRALATTYGPFPSRAAAERYADSVLDLFKLRRCHEELAPAADHPGCIYGEMNRCLRPCQRAQIPEAAAEYTAETASVRRFLDTRGESLVIAIGIEREEASAAMHFERAAELHAQWHKVRAVQALADELVQPIPRLRALIIQKQAVGNAQQTLGNEQQGSAANVQGIKAQGIEDNPDPGLARPTDTPDALNAAVFLVESGCIYGPEPLSTLGVRAVREQTSVGSSLFAQPLMLQAIPLEDPSPAETAGTPGTPGQGSADGDRTTYGIAETDAIAHGNADARGDATMDSNSDSSVSTDSSVILTLSATKGKNPRISPPRSGSGSSPLAPTLPPETRAQNTIAALEAQAAASSGPADLATLSDHLSILRRWYYRPEKQRAGEVFFPTPEAPGANAHWPIRRILNGAARTVLGTPARMADTQRDLAQRNPADAPLKTKVLHEGRPDVERIVPVLDKPAPFRSRRRAKSNNSPAAES